MARERELIRPPPGLGSLDALTPPTLLLMAIAGALAVLDGVFSHSLIVVSLLAFPPVIAATRVSVAETALVGVFCLSLAILSGLWNENFGASDYFVRLLVVLAGAGAAVWVAGLRVSLARERDSADLLAETGLLLQESWDAGDRVEHIARLAVPDLADAATVDLCGRNRSILRSATVARDPEVEAAFERMRDRHPVDPDSAHPAAVAIRTGEMVLHDDLPDEMLESFGENRGEVDLIRRTRPSSVMVVPLKARGTVLGALSMWILDPSRAHDTRAQNVALRLAHRAAFGPRQRPPARTAVPHRPRSAGRAAPTQPARDRRLRVRLALPRGRRRRLRGRRGLLRRLRHRLGDVDGRDRRRVRQGARGGRPDRARPLHDPHRLDARVHAKRGAADAGRVDRRRPR